MANGYMPRADAAARGWMRAFADALAARPGVFHASAGEVEAVSLAVDAFEAALAVTGDPGRRSAAAIVAKDDARAAAELACRPTYARIKGDPTVPDADKVLIGVRPIARTRPRHGPPDAAPTLLLREVRPAAHVFTFSDETASGRAAKPCGVAGLQLFRTLAASADAPPGPAAYVGTYTRAPFAVLLSASDDLKVATYFGRWIDRRGRAGPWSRPVTRRVNCEFFLAA